MKKLEHSVNKGKKTTLFGIVTNLILAIVKGLAGYFGNAYVLIADAIESTFDIFSSIIVFCGLKISVKPADKNHPYGHGRAEPIAAIIIALTLVIAAFIISIQSIKDITIPHHSPAPFTLFILLGVIITKELLFRFVVKVGNKIKSTAVKTDAWHHRSDAITSAAAFIGIFIALVGGKGFEHADDWAALFASGIIMINATRLFIPAFNEIMDIAPDQRIINKIKRITQSVPGVLCIEKLRARKTGFNYYVDIHIYVDGNLSVRKGHEIAHNVKKNLYKSDLYISDASIHIEPHNSPK